MSKYKDIVKNGWHPKETGGSIRGQVSGLVRRNKSDEGTDHVAQPLSTLRDPSSFAPPPKRTGSGLTPAPKPQKPVSRKVVAAPSKYQDPRAEVPVQPPPRDTRVSPDEDYQPPQEQGVTGQEEEPVPSGPYRVNTTGLSTDHLPRPPGRRDTPEARLPPPRREILESKTSPSPPSYEAAVGGKAPPPRLPPRLPPRTNTGNSTSVQSPAAASNSNAAVLNQGAISRLGAAGVSVPGLGIGPSNGNSEPSPMSPLPPPRVGGNAQVNQLQNRFSKLGTSSPTSNSPSQGTTWAQKQAALNTASSFQKDPSSVSLADARSAASTANNFRQRHGEQVAAGVHSANNINQKYGVADKVGGVVSGGPQQEQTQGVTGSPTLAGLAGKKKPPPPPVKKKPTLSSPASPAADAQEGGPPPIPHGTRPAF